MGDAANCPNEHGDDLDFAASPVLAELREGRRVLVVGQKSGVVYGLDPDDGGKVLWTQRIGKGGFAGGIQWGMAADGGGTFAIRLDTGDVVWHTGPQCGGNGRCQPAQAAAVTGIPGAVFSGSLDGYLRGYSTVDGRVLWSVNTARE
jgi:polyvinyl alcohol dehydrogenase (cytochrome)